MKRLFIILSVFAFGLFIGSSGLASTVSLPQSFLMDTTNFVDLDGPSPYTPNSGSEIARSTLGTNGATYQITLDGSAGWSYIQFADGFDHPSNNSGLTIGAGTLGGDLTGYTDYKLKISNPNTSGPSFMANISLNTGWTDPPDSETDNFYQNGWTWIAPGTSHIFTIDLTSVANLNHVSQIGFQIGANVTGDESWNSFNWNNSFNVDVAAVPIPGAVWLLGSGLFGLVGIRRKIIN